LFTAQLNAQPFFKLDSKRVTLPFTFIRNMIVVKLRINDKGPYNFILDSGVGLMIITDPSLIDSLNIKAKRSISVAGMGQGKDFEAYIVPSLKVDLPGIAGASLSAAILKKDEFGLSNYAGVPIHGLLGYEFFSSFTVRVNFSDTTIVAGLPKDMRVFKRGGKLPLTIEGQRPYITSKVKVNGNNNAVNNKLIVDLGAGHPLSLENLVGQNHGLPEKFIASDLGISLTGPIRGFLSRIDQIDIGKYRIKNVITSFPEYDTIKNQLLTVKRDGNIGIQLLKKFDLIMDYQNGWLYFRPNQFYDEVYEEDMSGIEYYAKEPDYKHIYISNVERGSAAADIGLQKGDEILSINLIPVTKLTIGQIDNIFRSRNDRSILLEIFHDNQYDDMVLVLKRRI
jgi:hypothetical protein